MSLPLGGKYVASSWTESRFDSVAGAGNWPDLSRGQFHPAVGAVIGRWRAIHAAVGTDQVGILVSPMDDEIANVGNPGEGIGKDKHGISLVEQRITEQQERADQAQPPERRRHDDLFLFFRRIPLDEETGKKRRVAQPANHFPDVPFYAQENSVVPDQDREGIHHSASSF